MTHAARNAVIPAVSPLADAHSLRLCSVLAHLLRGTARLSSSRDHPARRLLPAPGMAPRVVRDIMTAKVVYMLEEENLERIGKGMERFKFRHLPVIDGGKLVGIVSQRDYLRASVSDLDPDFALKNDNLKRNIFVAEIMTRDVVSVRPDTPLLEAAKLLREHRFGCLPVTEADGSLVGIVTDYDFVGLTIALLE